MFRSRRASRLPRSLADLASSNSSRRPSKRAARASGSTKYTKRKISSDASSSSLGNCGSPTSIATSMRSEEHTSELQSLRHLVCRLLLEKKKKNKQKYMNDHI